MNLVKQTFLTIGLVACATIVAARFYPGSHAILGGLGVRDTVIAIVARSDDAANENAGTGGPHGGGPPAAVVTTAPVSTAAISATAQAVGSSEALRSVSVVPLDAGVLTQVAVNSGDIVAAGDLVAQLNADTEEVTRDRAVVALRSAEVEFERYERLSKADAASQSELDTLRADRDDAALALREAEVALEQRSIFTPIGGVLGIVPVEVGDYVTTETEIAIIDDRSQIVVDFWLPERFVGMLTRGQPVKAAPLALSGREFSGTVNAIGSRVETDSRTLQVRALIDNQDDQLRPGMSFAISLSFNGDTYPSVDPLAVQWDADGSYVWTVANGAATRTAAVIVQRNADMVLIDAVLEEGTQVVIEGTLNVRDGAAVSLADATSPDDGAADGGAAEFGEGHTQLVQPRPTETEG